jgi:hypothetical protein
MPYHDIALDEPDFIIVERLGVTPSEIRRQPGVAGMSGADRAQSATEIEVGGAFSDALRDKLIAELREEGIRAYSRADAPEGTWKTGIIHGYYFTGSDAGGDSSLGMQLDDKKFRMRFNFNMREVTIADATVDMTTRLDEGDGMQSDTVYKEAQMVADKLVKELVIPAYKRRGWSI